VSAFQVFREAGGRATDSIAASPAFPEPERQGLAICVVGPGWRFTSGISYYTCRLANALADHHEVSVIQLRQLVPKRLYPGRERVGQPRAAMTFLTDVRVFDGVDWWWGRSLFQAISFMRANRPRVFVLEWWTAATLHTYLALAITARLFGARVVLEMHEQESQDPSDASFVLIRRYGRLGLGLLLRISHGCVLHSKADQRLLEESYSSIDMRVAIAPHGPFDQYNTSVKESFADKVAVAAVRKAPRPAVVNLLFFGLIRAYKGLEDLLEVFNALSEDEVAALWLTVVGETWGRCTEPARLIETSPHCDRITFVNEYVPDEVVGAAFAHADVVVLPYHRSSSSGTLHIAMSCGLPVVVTSVGGLPEAADGYEGAIFVPPGDLMMLKLAIKEAARMAGRRFRDPRDWAETVEALLFAADARLKTNENSGIGAW
jgi:glycosyltransferase involved in cell wall biosynthesis